MHTFVLRALEKFDLNLNEKVVLTEAATGNYVVTPILAALAGAQVYAYTKNSRYGSVSEVIRQTQELANDFSVQNNIVIIEDFNGVDLECFDIVTNTGFVRPIDRNFVSALSSDCVIPLMWEPWEFRETDLDLRTCLEKNIKVYGTNEDHHLLKTKDYLGYIALFFLLKEKISPLSKPSLLLLGSKHFVNPIYSILKQNDYHIDVLSEYTHKINVSQYDAIILAEHGLSKKLIGMNGFIHPDELVNCKLVLHICGDADFDKLKCPFYPDKPANFGYMSYTTDFIDPSAVIDLHAAGLKVGEGMLKANSLNLKRSDYKLYMENNYPALAFADWRYW